MSKRILLTVAFGFVVGCGVALAPAANAQVAFPTSAKQAKFWMVRAMDPCTPSGLSIIGTGLPASGCLQANTVTDGTTLMKYARVRITKNGRIALSGNGFTFGDILRVRLQLRITKRGLTTKNPTGSNKSVTFADQDVDCPPSPAAFTVRPNGTIAAATTLDSCLAPYTGLAAGSSSTLPNDIEIVDASLVNAMVGGKVIARPGILR